MANRDGDYSPRRKRIERGTAWTSYRLELARQAEILLATGEPPSLQQPDSSRSSADTGKGHAADPLEHDPVLAGGWWASDVDTDANL